MKERETELSRSVELQMVAIPPFNFRLSVCKPSHFPTRLETYDDEEECFYRTIRLMDTEPVGLKIMNLEKLSNEQGLFVEVYSQGNLSVEKLDSLKKHLRRSYGLDDDINDFYKHAKDLAPIVRNLNGMRNSCAESLYEIANISILLQNTNIKRTENMMKSLLSRYGDLVTFGNKNLFVFYTPESIARSNEQALRDLKIGYRANYVLGIAKYFLENEGLESELKKMEPEVAKNKLLEIRGVGPYTANLILFSYLRCPNFINFDVWNRKLLSTYLFGVDNVPLQDLADECEKRWGRYKGYAALYIIENEFVQNPKLQYWKNN